MAPLTVRSAALIFLVVAVLAAGAAATPIAVAPSAQVASASSAEAGTSVLLVRSCADCAEGSYCEFAHPDATAELPLACTSHVGTRALYRRYAPADDGSCLNRPDISTKLYNMVVNNFSTFCYAFLLKSGNWVINQKSGACPGFSGGFNVPIDISLFPDAGKPSTTPGACFGSNGDGLYVKFGDNCNDMGFYSSSACSGSPVSNLGIATVPYASET